MCAFLDGPATGETLLLARAPLLLRVTRRADGAWDALDQLADAPTFEERITVYRRIDQPTVVHIDAARGRSGWFRVANYRVVEPQPRDDQVRTTTAWRRWAQDFVTPTRLEGMR